MIDILETYLYPENDDWDALFAKLTAPTPPRTWSPSNENSAKVSNTLNEYPPTVNTSAKQASSATVRNERFLRRLWRDLYPDEPVPGGDEEFRDDLRRTINEKLELPTSTTRYYVSPHETDMAAAARRT